MSKIKKLNKQQVRIISISIIVVFFAVIGILKYTSVRADWYNSNWDFKKAVTVGNTGGDATDEDVLITIDTATLISEEKMQADCDDIRFTDSDESTLLDYWLENECNSSSTRVWVRIPSLPSGGKTIYFYYANSDATNAEETWSGNFITLADDSCPSGWSRDTNFDDKFPIASASANQTGGTTEHTHGDISGTTGAAPGVSNGYPAGTTRYTARHAHTFTVTTNTQTDVLPPYLDMIICSSNNYNAFTGMITLFDDTVPSGWTRFSALDGLFPKGAASYGGTGGSATHDHTYDSGTTSTHSGYEVGGNTGTAVSTAQSHSHGWSAGSLDAADNTPPYYTVIWGKSDDSTLLANPILMTTANPPLGWTQVSTYNSKFFYGSETHGSTGGDETHNHSESTSTGTGGGSGSTGAGYSVTFVQPNHAHSMALTSNSMSNYPPFYSVNISERKISQTTSLGSEIGYNAPPNAPTISDNYLHDKTKTLDTTPEIRFTGTDTESDAITYQIAWSTDSSFSSSTTKVSDTDAGFTDVTDGGDTDPFDSGDIISYTFQTELANGTTYFYRIRGKDPLGGNYYGSWSSTRSFAIDTSLNEDGHWYETHADQFSTDTLTDVTVSDTNNNVYLTTGTGTVLSTAITQANINSDETNWGTFIVDKTETNGSILIQFYYDNSGTPTIIPDLDLSNNSTGFSQNVVDLSGLLTAAYPILYTKATLTYSSGSPTLNDWGIIFEVRGSIPSLDLPTDTLTGVPVTTVFKTTSLNGDGNYLRYKIEVCTDESMTTECQTFDQTSSQTGWSGQNTESNTAYTSGAQAVYTVQTVLDHSSIYYWRSYSIDPGGSNTWSDTQTSPYSFTTSVPPNLPSLDSPSDDAINQSVYPLLKTTATDDDGDYLQYKIILCEDVTMNSNCQTFDQTSSQTGWSGQDANGNTAYASGTQAVYTIQTILDFNTAYYWKSYTYDPAGSETWSSTQTSPYYFLTGEEPTQPTILFTENASNPTTVTDITPEFSAICNHTVEDATFTKYQIQVDDNKDYGSPVWDSGESGTDMTSCTSGSRSAQISYAGTTLSRNGNLYYWRIRFIDEWTLVSPWSSEHSFFMMDQENAPGMPTSCRIKESDDDSSLTLLWDDKATGENQYRIEKNTDGAGFTLLTNESANATSHVDSAVSSNHTYQYRVRAEGSANSEWCTTTAVNTSLGNFLWKGLNIKGINLR